MIRTKKREREMSAADKGGENEPQDYPAQSPEESLPMAKRRQQTNEETARQQTSTPDNSKNKRTLSAPKRNKDKNKAENRVSKKTTDQV
jgi:hypothetical protein